MKEALVQAIVQKKLSAIHQGYCSADICIGLIK